MTALTSVRNRKRSTAGDASVFARTTGPPTTVVADATLALAMSAMGSRSTLAMLGSPSAAGTAVTTRPRSATCRSLLSSTVRSMRVEAAGDAAIMLSRTIAARLALGSSGGGENEQRSV